MFFHMVYKSEQIFLPFCHNPRVWQTDRRTDGQTEFSSQYRDCITCSAVIKSKKHKRANWQITVARGRCLAYMLCNKKPQWYKW